MFSGRINNTIFFNPDPRSIIINMENLNPKVHQRCSGRITTSADEDDTVVDEIDSREVFGEEGGVYFFC